MAEQTEISWTDSTFNPWVGCTKVSPACDHCYAERVMDTRLGRVEWGPGKPRSRTSAANWRLPLRWNRDSFLACKRCGWRGTRSDADRTDPDEHGNGCPACDATYLSLARRRVFCASLADWLDNEVPTEWLVDLLDLIRQTPNLDWLLLSKRIGNWRKRLEEARDQAWRGDPETIDRDKHALGLWIDRWLSGEPPAHVWLGATVPNQPEADRDVPKILAVPARVRFLSIEPMLGPMDLRFWIGNQPAIGASTFNDGVTRRCDLTGTPVDGIHWVIAGGESGNQARPMHPGWVRSLRDQCQAADVAFHFKQWGEWHPVSSYQIGGRYAVTGTELILMLRKDRVRPAPLHDSDLPLERYVGKIGKEAAGRQLDGREWSEFPATLATSAP